MTKRLTPEEIEKIKTQEIKGEHMCLCSKKLLSHIEVLEKDLSQKDQQIEKMRKALEFYAEERYFQKLEILMVGDIQILLPEGTVKILDGGEMAREALKGELHEI